MAARWDSSTAPPGLLARLRPPAPQTDLQREPSQPGTRRQKAVQVNLQPRAKATDGRANVCGITQSVAVVGIYDVNATQTRRERLACVGVPDVLVLLQPQTCGDYSGFTAAD